MESGDCDADKMPEEMREKLLKYAKGNESVLFHKKKLQEENLFFINGNL